jgi:hypothetical protein
MIQLIPDWDTPCREEVVSDALVMLDLELIIMTSGVDAE